MAYPVNLPVDLVWLRQHELFREHDPVIPIDLADPEICGGPGRLSYRGAHGVRQMILQADRTCYLYTGQKPPSQVGLFLAQFPDGEDDSPESGERTAYALAALHLHKEIGPGCCAAAIWIEPLEYDEVVGAQIQRWACYHLTRHPWATGRGYAERVLRSAKIKWVSPEGRAMVEAYVRAHHPRHGAFFDQPQLPHHPLHDGPHRARA